MIVTIATDRIDTGALQLLGSGGEAKVFALNEATALKVYKREDDPDFANDAAAREAARERLATAEDKLRCFPRGLPAHVLAPTALAVGPDGRLAGFTMDRLGAVAPWYVGSRAALEGQRGARALGARRLLHLGRTISRLHQRGVVIGDLSDLNLLVRGEQVLVIDADSFQFAGFPCTVFNPRFCDPRAISAAPGRTRYAMSEDTDWYAFSTLTLLALLGLHPYAGVAHATDAAGQRHRLDEATRLRERVTVFDARVTSPRSAAPLEALPQALREHLALVFGRDLRGPFPLELLERAQFSSCPRCLLEYAESRCPRCGRGTGPRAFAGAGAAAALVETRLVVRTDRRVVGLTVSGVREQAWVEGEGEVLDATGTERIAAPTAAEHRVSLVCCARREAVWQDPDQLALVWIPTESGRGHELTRVDVHEGAPAVAFAGSDLLWSAEGVIWRRALLGAQRLASLPSRRVRLFASDGLWGALALVGSSLQAAVGTVRGVAARDGIVLDRAGAQGEPIDLGGVAGADHLWLSWTRRGASGALELCCLSKSGRSVARTSLALAGSPSLGLQRGFVHDGALYLPTDLGIVRLAAAPDGTVATEVFADTEGLVSSNDSLRPGAAGIYVISANQVTELRRRPSKSPQPTRSRP